MTRLSIASVLALVFPLAVAACGGAETPAKPAQPQPTAAADDGKATCVQAFQRQRECTDVFIPVLVAARVKHDMPPGIAAEDAKAGRDALVAQAMEEWKVDSTDEAIGTVCDRMQAEMPPDQIGPMVERAKQCLAAADCQAFTDCMMPIVEEHMTAPRPE